MLVGNVCLPRSCHDKTSKQIKLTTKGGQEPRGFFVLFFSQEIYLVLYFPSNILPNSYGQPDYVLSAVIGKTAGLSPQTTWEEHSSERCAGAPCRNQSLQKPQHPQPGVHMHREREHREKGRKWKKKVPVALSGEGVKKANRNQQPTKDKHSTKKLQGKFKHWGPHSRKLVTWVTSWNFTAKYPFFFLIWKDKLLAFLNNFNMFNGWKLSSNCSAYWIKC